MYLARHRTHVIQTNTNIWNFLSYNETAYRKSIASNSKEAAPDIGVPWKWIPFQSTRFVFLLPTNYWTTCSSITLMNVNAIANQHRLLFPVRGRSEGKNLMVGKEPYGRAEQINPYTDVFVLTGQVHGDPQKWPLTQGVKGVCEAHPCEQTRLP